MLTYGIRSYQFDRLSSKVRFPNVFHVIITVGDARLQNEVLAVPPSVTLLRESHTVSYIFLITVICVCDVQPFSCGVCFQHSGIYCPYLASNMAGWPVQCELELRAPICLDGRRITSKLREVN